MTADTTNVRWCEVCKAYRKKGHEADHLPSLFDPPEEERRAIAAPTRVVGRDHPETAQAMQRHVLPRSGTFRREVYDLIAAHGGLTDYELEDITGRSHQSVSGARATLKKDRWVRDSGKRRVNRYNNDAVVWVVA